MNIDDFIWLLKRDRREDIKKIIAGGFDINQQDGNLYTPLIFVSEHGYLEMVDILLDAKADVNAKFECIHPKQNWKRLGDGSTALMKAAWNGHDEVVRKLIAHGADIDAQDLEGCTALFYAVIMSNHSTVELLLNAGAKSDIKTNRNATALMHAISGSDNQSAKLLIDSGADIHVQNSEGENVLMMACQRNQIAMAERLIGLGADVNAQDKNGNSVLMVMAHELWSKNQREILEMLLNTDIDITLTNNTGKTAMSIARDDDRDDWASYLESRILEKTIHPSNKQMSCLDF